jgi:uncharacterized protein (DUF433 family)
MHTMAAKIINLDCLASLSDPRDIPAYTIPEAARYVRIPQTTARAWFLGTTTGRQQQKRWFEPVLALPLPDQKLLAFSNLAEMFVLRSLREMGVSLDHIRQAIDTVKAETGLQRPLIEESFRTNGVRLFIDRLGKTQDAVTKQQLLLPQLMESHLQRMSWEDSLAARLYPFPRGIESSTDDRPIVIDYRRSFGRPIVDAIGVPTSIIFDRWQRGDSIAALAQDYQCELRPIEDALCYESAAAQAA